MQAANSMSVGSNLRFGQALARIPLCIATIFLVFTLGACGGGSSAGTGTTVTNGSTASTGTGTNTNTNTSTNTSISASIGTAGGTLALANAKLDIPAGALVAPVNVSISLDSSAAPAAQPDVTATSVVFALLPHGTTFSSAVTLTIPFDPAALPSGVAPRLYKAEVGGAFTEIPSTVVGTTLVASIQNFSWAQSGYTLKPQVPVVQVEADHQAARVSWTGVPGESYQVCNDITPSSVIGSFYPSNCVSATPPYVVSGLKNDISYTFGVVASNSAGSSSSGFVNGTPKALGRQWVQPASGSADPYGCNPSYTTETNSCGYKDVAYLRGKDGQDYFVAVKSTRQWMRVAGAIDPVHITNTSDTLFNVQSVAAGNGLFVAVGASGTIGVSSNYGQSWDFVQYQANGLNGDITYNAVTYVPDSLNRPGRFIAVGTWTDSFGYPHDLVSTIDPTVGCFCNSSGLVGLYHSKYTEYSGLAAVSSDGLIAGGTNGSTYYDYSAGIGNAPTFIAGSFRIKITGNVAAGTAAGHTLARSTLSATDALPFGSMGLAAKVFKYNGNYWALTSGTGGQYSSDGQNWANHYFQIINPYTQLGGIAVGPGQLVAVTYLGDTLYNTSGTFPKSAWTTTNSAIPAESNSYRKVIYGASRYLVVGSRVYISN